MNLWEPGSVETLSGLETEPKKQERKLLIRVSVTQTTN